MNPSRYKTHNSIKIVLVFLASILILLLANFPKHNLYSIGVLAIISYIVYFTSWFFHYKIKLNFYTLFLSLTLAFYFGQFLLLVLGVPMDSGRTIIDNRLPLSDLINTGVFIINSMTILHIGVLISTYDINKYNSIFTKGKERTFLKNKKLLIFKKVALFILIISIVPSISILLENIYITMTQGYGAIFQSEHYTTGGFNNIRRFISLFTIPSFLMVLIAYKNDKKIKFIKLIFGLYLSLYFLSGSRMAGIMLILSILLIVHYWYKPINTRKALQYSIIALIILILLSTISNVRNALYLEDNSIQATFDAVKNTWHNNPVFAILEEAGFTFLATGTVLAYSPSVIPYQFGMSYINSILMLFPNVFWEVHPAAAVNTDIIFSGFLTQYGGIGSSFIAEAYWNFGQFSFIFIFFIGNLLGLITKKIAMYAEKGNVIKFFLFIHVARIVFTYVRSDTVSFWRNFVYYGVVPIVLVYLIEQFARKSRTT